MLAIFGISFDSITMVSYRGGEVGGRGRGGAYMRDATFSLAITPSLDREMFSGSVDAGFVLALAFHHGDLEPDHVGVSTRGERGPSVECETERCSRR